jgi:hypothetical protein
MGRLAARNRARLFGLEVGRGFDRKLLDIAVGAGVDRDLENGRHFNCDRVMLDLDALPDDEEPRQPNSKNPITVSLGTLASDGGLSLEHFGGSSCRPITSRCGTEGSSCMIPKAWNLQTGLRRSTMPAKSLAN